MLGKPALSMRDSTTQRPWDSFGEDGMAQWEDRVPQGPESKLGYPFFVISGKFLTSLILELFINWSF